MKKLILIAFFGLLLTHTLYADACIDRIVDVHYGSYAGFGQNELPDCVLGPPQGAGLSGGSLHVLSLGNGGSITLEFVDNLPQNGVGADLIVFENAFFVGGDSNYAFAEAAFVEVSQDGVTFFRFPNDYNPDGEPVNHPSNWMGFAGILPVMSHPDNGIDPTDPLVSGGDLFDLDDVGLDWIRFVRIIDTDEPPDAAMDDDGDSIYDPAVTSEGNSGFDLDAICAVHSVDIATPTPAPEPSVSPTPDRTSTPVVTPTPAPQIPTLDLDLSESHFYPGAQFRLNLNLFNPLENTLSVNQFVILDVGSMYLFWPSWSNSMDYDEMEIQIGQSTQTILSFIWPDVSGNHNRLVFWAALLDSEMNLVGNLDSVEFSY